MTSSSSESTNNSTASFTRSGDGYSRSRNRYFSTSVSNVPQDVSDEDALSGAWQRRRLPPKNAEQLDWERAIELSRQIANEIRQTNNLELEIDYGQKRLKQMKRTLLYDVEHLDSEIIDRAIDIATDLHKVRKTKDLLERWTKEASATREEGELQDARTTRSDSTNTTKLAAASDKA